MVDRMISPFTLMSGPILFIISVSLLRAFTSWTGVVQAFCVYVLWVLLSRTLRILPHFYRCPGVLSPPNTFLCHKSSAMKFCKLCRNMMLTKHTN